jgi:arylsulfatase A-like enzyme
MGKQNTYEVGMKVPFFISGPGITPGNTDALVYLHDIFPTLADYAGGSITEQKDGVSLRPVIEGKAEIVRDHLTLAYQDSQRTIRNDRWKLMVFPQINQLQLFDLKNDPDELHNIAEANPEVVSGLKKYLRTELKKNGDTQALQVEAPIEAVFKAPQNQKVSSRLRVGGESKRQTSD